MPTNRAARRLANLFLCSLILAAAGLTGAAVAKAEPHPKGYVTFDGVTFRNLTPYRVLIAGRCG